MKVVREHLFAQKGSFAEKLYAAAYLLVELSPERSIDPIFEVEHVPEVDFLTIQSTGGIIL